MNSFEEKNDTKDKSNDFEKSPEENKEIEDLCEKLIVKNTCLASNVRTVHKSERNYTCDTCGKDFGKFGNLKTHVTNVHEGLKEHKCHLCSKSFGQAGSLKIHISTVHEGLKTHNCLLCGKSFFLLFIVMHFLVLR